VLLPDDCWEQVFKIFLKDGGDRRYLESLSLSSKQFLSITNRLRFSLSIWKPTLPFLYSLLHRFPYLTSIDLTRFSGDLDALLSQISCFPLKLTSLNLSNQPIIPTKGLQGFSQKITTLTSLTCSNIAHLHTNDFFLIADCFPLLEELDLSFPIYIDSYDDFEINALSLALPKLRKVNLSGSYYINDSSLYHLCKNCEILEEVAVFNCKYLTHIGIASAIRERPNLKSLSISLSEKVISMELIDSLRSLKGLSCLDLSFSLCISNQLLSSLADEGLPLKRLVLRRCSNNGYQCSFPEIINLLSRSHSIKHLDLQNTRSVNDYLVDKLSVHLRNLVSINLNHCRDLTESTFFKLVAKCPFLEEIRMEYTCIGKLGAEEEKYRSLMDFVVRPSMKSLHLSSNQFLNDETIKMFASIFPNLQFLDISSCSCISEGIVEVLRRCLKIMHLNLTSCPSVNLLGMNFQIPKLEVLNFSMTKINDETLYVISKSCSGLLLLDLEGCCYITEKGVMEILKNCTRLKEINLRHCRKVAADVGLWTVMVFSRPSLRKIMTPYYFHPSNRKWKPILDHGCFLC